jgi:hypothetical protein
VYLTQAAQIAAPSRNEPTCPEPRLLTAPMAITIAQNAYQIVSGFQPRSLAWSLASAARLASILR